MQRLRMAMIKNLMRALYSQQWTREFGYFYGMQHFNITEVKTDNISYF